MVWEQDVRVLVMLTAESEGGQRKCHPYWLPNNYGPLKVKALSEKRVSLEPSSSGSSPARKPANDHLNPPLTSPLERTTANRRRATNPLGGGGSSIDEVINAAAPPSTEEKPYLIVRKIALSHASFPFQPIREITQLQYSSWPDFGVPAHPVQVLSLIEHCNAVVRSYRQPSRRGSGATGDGVGGSSGANEPARSGERPVLVHCSAGCGRTGTFVTIDAVVDMLKRQKLSALQRSHLSLPVTRDSDGDDNMDSSSPEDSSADEDDDAALNAADWVARQDIDLVAKAVEDLRTQRLSMVQTLRQFVLCYEAVLEWLVREMPEKYRREGVRRSYQG
jgi:protein tyrosine phosphatase